MKECSGTPGLCVKCPLQYVPRSHQVSRLFSASALQNRQELGRSLRNRAAGMSSPVYAKIIPGLGVKLVDIPLPALEQTTRTNMLSLIGIPGTVSPKPMPSWSVARRSLRMKGILIGNLTHPTGSFPRARIPKNPASRDGSVSRKPLNLAQDIKWAYRRKETLRVSFCGVRILVTPTSSPTSAAHIDRQQ